MTVWFLLALLFVMLAVPVFADDGHGHGHHHDDGGGDLIGGDNTASNIASIAGSRSYGISGSDMDIGQCIYHQGALTLAVGFRNKFCEGMDMIRVGMVEAGVLHICKQTKIGKNYKTLKDCKDGMVLAYVEPNKPTEHTSDDDEDDWKEALYARMTDLEEIRVQDKARAEKAAKTASARAVRAEQHSVSQYGITDEQRQELAEVFKQ